MKTFHAVLLCLGSIYLAAAAPVHRDSPHEYEYDYEQRSPQQQAQEPQESASHYDAYIQDVKAAASGGNTPKKGFSRGSGLRTIAVGSANQAKTALGNQAAAGYQAAYVAKNTLAQSAAQASATAQAALAGKQVILSGLEQQVRDAKVALQGEEMQLQQAKRAAQAAAQAAQQAMHQVNVIQAALNAAQATSENANEAASQAAGELGAQTAMVGAARQRLHTLQEQLQGVRIDFEATQAAARKAQAAAQQAQANAAEAAAKAAAAGLGGQHKDASHEEPFNFAQAQSVQVSATRPSHSHEANPFEPDNIETAPENPDTNTDIYDTQPIYDLFADIPPITKPKQKPIPIPKFKQIKQQNITNVQFPPIFPAFNQFKPFTFKPLSLNKAKPIKPSTNKPLAAKPAKLSDAKTSNKVLPDTYINLLENFYKGHNIFGFYG